MASAEKEEVSIQLSVGILPAHFEGREDNVGISTGKERPKLELARRLHPRTHTLLKPVVRLMHMAPAFVFCPAWRETLCRPLPGFRHLLAHVVYEFSQVGDEQEPEL